MQHSLLWVANAALLLFGSTLPWMWLLSGTEVWPIVYFLSSSSFNPSLTSLLGADAIFAASAAAFLALAVYLPLAFTICLALPSFLLAHIMTSGPPMERSLALKALVPYLLLFGVQTFLETRWLRYSITAPMIPVVFMAYRPWQLVRAASIVGGLDTMLGGTIAMLFAFWIFDTAALISWMPFSYNYHLHKSVTVRRRSDADSGGAVANGGATIAKGGPTVASGGGGAEEVSEKTGLEQRSRASRSATPLDFEYDHRKEREEDAAKKVE